MTLVVAKILDEKLYLESDSKITGDTIVRNDPLESQLKVLILEPRLYLCYAGNINYAQDAYDYYINKKTTGLNKNDFTTYLLKLNIASKNSTDFILAGYKQNNSPVLLKICNGTISNVQTAWIGSKKGFSKFQEVFANQLSKGIEPKYAINNAFNDVLKSEVCDSIGNIPFSVITNDKEYIDTKTSHTVKVLQYEQGMSIITGRDMKIEIKEKGEFIDLPSGNENTGSYAISYFTPVGLQESCVGVHFGYGNFGIFYPPKNLLDSVIYTSVNAQAFISRILKDYNISLAGMELMNETMSLKKIVAGKET